MEQKDVRILMIGLDDAGKTTILYKLKSGEVPATIPTIGFNVETVEYKDWRLTFWDIGGKSSVRALWRFYMEDTDAVIFVVDSANVDRLDEAAEELHKIMQCDELQNSMLLVFANKQDLSGAMSGEKVSEGLKLKELKQEWYLHPVCAIEGNSLSEGLDHLSAMLSKRKSQQ